MSLLYPLLCQYENALLAPKTQLQHPAVGVRDDFVVGYFCVALFPAAFGLRHDGLAFLDGKVIAVNQDTVITGFNCVFANVDGVSNGEVFDHGLGESGNGNRKRRDENQTADQGIIAHACYFLSRSESAERSAKDGRVDTQPKEKV